jgi:hypothetical protein
MLHAKAAIRSRKPTLYPAELRDQVDAASLSKEAWKSCSVFSPFSVALTAGLVKT